MGVLYRASQMKKNLKRDMVIDRLLELGVEQYEERSIHELDYDLLKTVLVLAEMRQVDIEHPEHKWFR